MNCACSTPSMSQPVRHDSGQPYRIALLNPNTSRASTALMMVSALSVRPHNVLIEGRNVCSGQAFIASPAALAEAALAVDACGPALADEGFDAIIVAGFGDPGVANLRRRLAIPVIGLGEAGIAAAAQGGLRYAIVTVTPDLHDSLLASAHAAAPLAQLAGIRYTDGQLGAVMHNPLSLEAALLMACQAAIQQDGAQAIVIGGGPLAQAAQSITSQLNIRIVDPVCAAVRQACLLGGISIPGFTHLKGTCHETHFFYPNAGLRCCGAGTCVEPVA
jgi:allantoin racemase